MRFEFPAGVAIVELVPEMSRLSLNDAKPEDLERLMQALGVEPERGREIAAAIVDWRSSSPRGSFDEYYLSLAPSFRARHASFEEVEEALLVKGMTPEIFYGRYARDASGRLARLSGLRDCVSVYGTTGPFDINGADPALLVSLGVAPEAAHQIAALRTAAPIRDIKEVGELAGAAARRLRVGGSSIYTLRSTARLRLPDGRFSDLRRTVAAQVKFLWPGHVPRYHVLRWWDQATSEVAQWQ
jgi:general secretion pathway protein K